MSVPPSAVGGGAAATASGTATRVDDQGAQHAGSSLLQPVGWVPRRLVQRRTKPDDVGLVCVCQCKVIDDRGSRAPSLARRRNDRHRRQQPHRPQRKPLEKSTGQGRAASAGFGARRRHCRHAPAASEEASCHERRPRTTQQPQKKKADSCARLGQGRRLLMPNAAPLSALACSGGTQGGGLARSSTCRRPKRLRGGTCRRPGPVTPRHARPGRTGAGGEGERSTLPQTAPSTSVVRGARHHHPPVESGRSLRARRVDLPAIDIGAAEPL